MGTGLKCVKFLLFAFNFLFLVAGGALIVLGGYSQTRDSTTFLDNSYVTLPIIMCVVGVLVFIVAFLGCCGALKSNYNMLMAFAILVTILLLLEIGCAIAIYAKQNDVKVIVYEAMNDTLVEQKNATVNPQFWQKNATNVKAFDQVQEALDCCGVDGPGDFKKYDLKKVPPSCCKDNKGVKEEEVSECSESSAYQDGCYNKLLKLIENKANYLAIAAACVALVQLIAVVFACCLASGIKKGGTA